MAFSPWIYFLLSFPKKLDGFFIVVDAGDEKQCGKVQWLEVIFLGSMLILKKSFPYFDLCYFHSCVDVKCIIISKYLNCIIEIKYCENHPGSLGEVEEERAST